MKAAVVAVGCLLAAVPSRAQEPGPVRAFVEVESAADPVYVQQAFELVVRIGIDAEWFAGAAVPLFQQRLDQPFQVVVPWLRGAEDRAVTALPAPAQARTQRIVVGDAVVDAEVTEPRGIDDRRHEVFVLRYRWLPLAAGTAAIDPVELRYAFATRFADDFLRGRQPLDRQEASVLSAPRSRPVRALPLAGRPPDFTGAVGEFTVRARTDVQRVRVGETFEVAVTLEGVGNLDRMAPLPPPILAGFHVQGVRDAREPPGRRTFVLAVLALREGARELPPIACSAFSPATGGYVVHRTAPLALVVEPTAAGTELPPAVAGLVRADAERVRAATPWWLRGVGLAVVLVLVCGVLRGRRQVRRGRELARAVAAVEVSCDGGAVAVAAAFDELLASTAHARDAAVLVAARQLRERLDAARFGGAMPARAEILACARALGAAPRARS